MNLNSVRNFLLTFMWVVLGCLFLVGLILHILIWSRLKTKHGDFWIEIGSPDLIKFRTNFAYKGDDVVLLKLCRLNKLHGAIYIFWFILTLLTPVWLVS